MQLRRLIANYLLSIIIISSMPIAYGSESVQPIVDLGKDITNKGLTEENTIEDENTKATEDSTVKNIGEVETSITDEEVDNAISNIKDINEQLDEIYNKVGNNLNIDYKYVKILHLLAGGQTVYADKKPNIYADETVNTMRAPFNLDGADTVYRQMQDVVCADQNINRTSGYYVPDAAYSVTYDIVQLMNQRYLYDRGGMQIYFDALKTDVKKQILFCEAVMLYTGEDEGTVDNLYRAYEKILYDKDKDENVIDAKEDGTFVFKNKYLQTLNDNNIVNENTIHNLAIILSFDKDLAISDNSETVKDEYVLPYISNYTSRENMLIAAMCLTGKVRYVWGGGHSGASSIDGINPVWFDFEQMYDDTPTVNIVDERTGEIIEKNSSSFGRCIKPSGSWCPIHGAYDKDCSFNDPVVNSLDEYIDVMGEYTDTSEIDTDKYAKLMNTLDFTNGIAVDRLNGLDCSGYASWIYNQITNRYNIDYTAETFASNTGIKEIEFGSKLLPGDVFAWKTHIVTIIGRTSDTNSVYITTESTPSVIKFGVVYYIGAKQSEIDDAKEIAKQANALFGGLNEYDEEPHVYCMNTAGSYVQYTDSDGTILTPTEARESSEDVEISTKAYNYCQIGRLQDIFIDEDLPINGYNIPIKEMFAKDIIQYTLSKMPYSYITGYNEYDGDIFNKEVVSSNLGVN